MLISLGKIISDLGGKVLIIDSNFRKPFIHLGLNLDNSNGLADLLKDNNLNWQKVIKNVAESKNLFAITTGLIKDDPISLFQSKNLESLFNEIKTSEKFDYVLIDFPESLDYSDALFFF